MADIILAMAGAFICTGTVLDAYYKTEDKVKKLIVKIGLLFSNESIQYVWETMCIDHNNPQTMMIGRNKAYKLALACGLDGRPDDPSVLVGEKVKVSFNIDENGNIKIKRFDKIDEASVPFSGEDRDKDLF